MQGLFFVFTGLFLCVYRPLLCVSQKESLLCVYEGPFLRVYRPLLCVYRSLLYLFRFLLRFTCIQVSSVCITKGVSFVCVYRPLLCASRSLLYICRSLLRVYKSCFFVYSGFFCVSHTKSLFFVCIQVSFRVHTGLFCGVQVS